MRQQLRGCHHLCIHSGAISCSKTAWIVIARGFSKADSGAEVDILVEVLDISEKGLGCCEEHSVCWLPGQLLTVVDVPAAGAALQDLLDVHGGSVKGVWEVGWALAPVVDNAQQLHSLLTSEVFTDTQLQEDVASQHGKKGEKFVAHVVAGVSRLGMAAAAATKIAVLSVGSHGDNSALNTCLKKLHQLSGLSKITTGGEPGSLVPRGVHWRPVCRHDTWEEWRYMKHRKRKLCHATISEILFSEREVTEMPEYLEEVHPRVGDKCRSPALMGSPVVAFGCTGSLYQSPVMLTGETKRFCCDPKRGQLFFPSVPVQV